MEKIKQQLACNRVMLYMKGDPAQPQCGFSARAVQCLQSYNVPFTTLDVLAQPEFRQALPKYADWPTFPQLYVDGELIGGSDIIAELHSAGELKAILIGDEK